MKKILVNYNFTPDKSWLGDDYFIYDRSDTSKYTEAFDPHRLTYTPNIGNVDWDKLSYLVENYDNLPDVFLWSKSNLFKYITWDEYVHLMDNKTFTPLLTQYHETYSDEQGPVCFYKDGMYYERNDSWYVPQFEHKHFTTFNDFAKEFGLPILDYIPFAPGGSYILTKETVHKYPKEFYDKLRNILPYTQLPAEAQMCERAYYLLWR